MNGIEKSKARQYTLRGLAAGTAVALVAAAFATPPSGVVGTPKARAGFAVPVDIKLKVGDTPQVLHVTDAADTVMQQIVFSPGSQSGWHSHWGPAIVLVTKGELTVYQANDPTCTGVTYGVGQSYVEPTHQVHLARNVGSEDTEVWVTYLDVASGAAARIDATDPGNCQF